MNKLMDGKDFERLEKPPSVSQIIRVSTCVRLENMFDPDQVDLNKDPGFYIEIKEQVYDVCQEWGSIDRIYVEQNSKGYVWIKFKGSSRDSATAGAEKTLRELNGRFFDNRQLTVNFVSEDAFYDKIKARWKL